ncbi:hypothetical protein GALMADRAFT_215809 [Galerina marginata CBS 339.88]|uniref:Uncharacterized protein n=1 Tax=Galerina marginata (strain CBS 339.88) TaxID=685588 RepID=A0A067SNL3_GALM3|nr:hypothetical protein GALMADRAFT_215809 [Galerina marginata CBS 339.88]
MASPTTSSIPSIIPTPILVFQNVPQPITCKPVNITWFYTGPQNPFTLVATNLGVSQDDPAPPLTSSSSKHFSLTDSDGDTDGDRRRAIPTGANNPMSIVTVPIASNVDPTSSGYSWPSVNIPQGWYMINATMNAEEYSCVSPPFFVHNGTDTSCISEIVIPSTSSSPTATPSSPASTGAVPVGGSSKLNLGAIVGVSVGAVVLVSFVLGAWLCLNRKARPGGVLGNGRSNRWNGLSSVDSRALTSSNAKHYPSARRQTRSESIGTIPISPSEEAVGAEKNSIYGKSNDHYGPLDGPGVSLAAMPVLQHQSPRSKAGSRTYSASSLNSNGFPSNEFATPPVRRPSVPDSMIGRRSIDSSNTYPPTSPVSPHGGRSPNQFTAANMSRSSHSSTSATQQTSTIAQTTPSQSTHGLVQQYRPAPSPSPQPDPGSPTSDATKQANRHSLGGRKRKPVPAYDPSREPTSPSLPRAMATPSPIPPSPSPGPDQVNATTTGAHYATRNHAGQDNSLPELAHKSSFGPGGIEGKPLHYLIPDMPMSSKD